MSEGTGQAGPSNPPASKAIPSQVKKQSDVTRLGTQKLKFVPTLPARRKKDDAKPEEPAPTPSTSEGSRGRGRGRGGPDARGRGRGRGGEGRGAAPRQPAVEMTASGPFAMGPAMAGTSAKRAAPRSNFAPIMPPGPGAKLGQGLTHSTAPSLGVKKEPNDLSGLQKGKGKQEEDDEVYSDADEGVEIVDMEKVRMMDWMAPESLRKEKNTKKKIKKEHEDDKKGVANPEVTDVDRSRSTSEETGDVNLANALHLSDSEEEEELEDIIDDFADATSMETDEAGTRQERLFFFQFPKPFPEFVSESTSVDKGKAPETSDATKKVSFADDTKPPAPVAAGAESVPPEEKATEKLDGIIGQLEVYASGMVKMRLSNGIVMDVTAATQPSFLQHAVHIDPENKRLCVLGEVNRRFIVSPDIESLLDTLERAEQQPTVPELEIEGLISMDTS